MATRHPTRRLRWGLRVDPEFYLEAVMVAVMASAFLWWLVRP